MEMTKEETKVQQSRRRKLRKLMDAFGIWPNMDYQFEHLTAIVGEQVPEDNDSDFEPESCPRYACVWSDETYSTLCLYDDQIEATTSMVPTGSDTLNIPGDIIDLDKLSFDKNGWPKTAGATVPYRIVSMSVPTALALAGIVAMSDGTDVTEGGEATNKGGILCDWDELRKLFPIEDFRKFVKDYDPEIDGEGYMPDAGY